MDSSTEIWLPLKCRLLGEPCKAMWQRGLILQHTWTILHMCFFSIPSAIYWSRGSKELRQSDYSGMQMSCVMENSTRPGCQRKRHQSFRGGGLAAIMTAKNWSNPFQSLHRSPGTCAFVNHEVFFWLPILVGALAGEGCQALMVWWSHRKICRLVTMQISPILYITYIITSFMSMDWFKGKSTGNHGFYHQI
jgi:hypothetical protein